MRGYAKSEMSGADLSRYSTSRTDTGIIHALKITDDTVGDLKIFLSLPDDVPSINDVTLHVMGDAAYAVRDIHRSARTWYQPIRPYD